MYLYPPPPPHVCGIVEVCITARGLGCVVPKKIIAYYAI